MTDSPNNSSSADLSIAIRNLENLVDEKIDSISSKDNSKRQEVPWEKREEDYLKHISDDVVGKALFHSKKTILYKRLFIIFGIPATLFPIVAGGFNNHLPCNSFTNSMLMMTSGLLSGIVTFFNFSKREEKHNQYENLYTTLNEKINLELSKPKRHRIACDLFMESIKSNYVYLTQNEPS